MTHQDWRKPRYLTLGAVLAAMTVTIQISPLYLPLIGVSLSALSTLPVALSAYLHGVTGSLTFLVSGVILCFWSVPQALVFWLSSGLLGLCLGFLMKREYSLPVVVGISALALTLGVLFAGKLLGVPALPWLSGGKRAFLVPLLLASSLLYTFIWVPVLSVLLARLRQLMEWPE